MKLFKNEKIKNIIYWITTILGPTSFVIGGVLFLTHGEQPIASMTHLGYPAYVLYILGVWKLLGAIVVTIPKFPLLKEWAYAGFFFELSGAAASHTFNGDPIIGNGPAQVISPIIFLILVCLSWALRPASRRLSGIPSL